MNSQFNNEIILYSITIYVIYNFNGFKKFFMYKMQLFLINLLLFKFFNVAFVSKLDKFSSKLNFFEILISCEFKKNYDVPCAF